LKTTILISFIRRYISADGLHISETVTINLVEHQSTYLQTNDNSTKQHVD